LQLLYIEIQTKNTVSETVVYAGKKYQYTTFIKYSRYEVKASEKDLKKMETYEKKRTHKGLDDLVDAIKKKKDINIYEKSKKDWDNYVNEKKIEKDLQYNRKDGYIIILNILIKLFKQEEIH